MEHAHAASTGTGDAGDSLESTAGALSLFTRQLVTQRGRARSKVLSRSLKVERDKTRSNRGTGGQAVTNGDVLDDLAGSLNLRLK